MTFALIPNGSQVFIDANTLVYYATADIAYGAACKHLMERIARRDIEGFTSAHVLSDLAHRVMTVEAMAHLGWQAKGIAARLRKNPSDVQKLTRFPQAVAEVPQIGIQVLPIDFDLVFAATALSQQYGVADGRRSRGGGDASPWVKSPCQPGQRFRPRAGADPLCAGVARRVRPVSGARA